MKKLLLVLSFLFALACSICICIYFFGSSIDEYSLITEGQITKGVVTKVKPNNEYIEGDESHNGGMMFKNIYTYKFLLNHIRTINGEVEGNIEDVPDDLDGEYPIKIRYLKENPNINYPVNLDSVPQNLSEWIRREATFRLIGIAIMTWLIFYYFKQKIINRFNQPI